ncbi:MAG TPA: DNA polymerase III subunit gamma/tau [Rickettsiales bacterium]|nr:DNA polymerase III subunit gamma/tau [Rickettsiales bacterium]
MEYRVLARKYRPQTFADLVGQDVLVRTLTNAFATGRIAHAFLLTGIRGIGKTTTARIIARALNCIGTDGQGGPTIEPCGVCTNCTMIAESRHMDVLEMDAASNTSVEGIRDIINTVQYLPGSARVKVYIIDEVHMLSNSAFNALLKTLEEPPPHVKFIFATTELRKIPVTILSRCQKFELKRIETEQLAQHLNNILTKESLAAEPEALTLIANAAEGSARDSLSLLDQAIAHNAGGDNVIRTATVRDMLGMNDKSQLFNLLEKLCSGDIGESLSEFRKLYAGGADPAILLQDLLALVHFVTRIKVTPSAAEDISYSQGEREFAKGLAQKLGVAVLTRFWQMLLKGLQETRVAPDPAASAEMTLIRIAHSSELPSPSDVIRGLRKGEGAAGAGSPAPSAPAPGRAPVSLITTNQVVSRPVEMPSAAPAPVARLENFAEAVQLFQEKREPLLYNYLMRHVRLVGFEMGRIELNIDVEVPLDFAGRVGKSLSDWTGTRWVVMLSREPGQATLQSQLEEKERREREAIASHPFIAEVLASFPGAEVVKITHQS